jgi:hypothetical protein
MRTNLAITAALVIMAAASLGIIQSAMATKGTPYDAGYDYKTRTTDGRKDTQIRL